MFHALQEKYIEELKDMYKSENEKDGIVRAVELKTATRRNIGASYSTPLPSGVDL